MITHRGHAIYAIYCYSKRCNYFLSVLGEKKKSLDDFLMTLMPEYKLYLHVLGTVYLIKGHT